MTNVEHYTTQGEFDFAENPIPSLKLEKICQNWKESLES